MTAGIVFSIAISLAAVAVLVAPLLRKDATLAERVAAATSEEIELHSRHDMVLASLRDLEEDRITGKLVEDDFAQMQAKLTGEAVELMKRLDEIDAQHKRDAAKKTITHPSSKSRRPSAK